MHFWGDNVYFWGIIRVFGVFGISFFVAGELRWAKAPIANYWIILALAFSERGQLSQAIPQFHVERMLNE